MSRACLKMLNAFSAMYSILLYVLRTLFPCVLIGKEYCHLQALNLSSLPFCATDILLHHPQVQLHNNDLNCSTFAYYTT